MAFRRDHVYRPGTRYQVLFHAGDTLAGGFTCGFPAARDYSVVRHGIRCWFKKAFVEAEAQRDNGLFEELYT